MIGRTYEESTRDEHTSTVPQRRWSPSQAAIVRDYIDCSREVACVTFHMCRPTGADIYTLFLLAIIILLSGINFVVDRPIITVVITKIRFSLQATYSLL